MTGHPKLTTTNWEVSSKRILLQLSEKLPKNSTLTILRYFGIWSKLERCKSLISVCLMSRLKKKSLFWSVIFSCFVYMQKQQTISRLDCDVQWKVDFVWQLVMINPVIGLRRSSKALSKAKLELKKGHGHCLVVCCPSDPLQLSNPSKTITSEKYAQQINEIHWKLQGLQLILVNRMGPVLLHNNALTLCPTTNASKVKWIGLWCFCLHHFHLTSHQSTTTSSSISTTFCRENASTTIRMQKMLSKSSSNLKAQVFMLEE